MTKVEKWLAAAFFVCASALAAIIATGSSGWDPAMIATVVAAFGCWIALIVLRWPTARAARQSPDDRSPGESRAALRWFVPGTACFLVAMVVTIAMAGTVWARVAGVLLLVASFCFNISSTFTGLWRKQNRGDGPSHAA